MNRVISILSLSVLLQSVFSSNELTRLRLSNGHITSHPLQASRNLDTYFIDFSYMNDTSVIEADFGTPFYTKNNGTNQNNTLMAVTISSNETVFFGNFSEGNDYFECDPSYCTQDNSTSFQYNSTWLTGNVTPITLTTPISVAFGAWQLATPALYMANAPSELEYPGGVYGSIGLGSGAGAQQNFYGQNPMFSLLYNFSSSSGDLIFGYNSTYANTSKPSMTVTSDPNWQMQLASISVGNQTVYTVNDTNPITMLFDLATQAIDLPSDVVTNITNGMSSLGMNCYGEGCTASNLTGLPSIIFTLADNTQLTLGPEVYMMSTGASSDSTDTSDSADPSGTSGINYVTIDFETLDDTGYFANHIVFGTQILAYFYTVFQQVNEGHTITLYSVPDGVTIEDQISPPITPDDSSPAPDVSTASNPKTHALYIIIAACVALLIVLIGAIILGVKRGWFKKKKAPESEESAITVELNESQVSGHSNEGLNL